MYCKIYDIYRNGKYYSSRYDESELRLDVIDAIEEPADNLTHLEIKIRRKKYTGKKCPHCRGPLFVSDIPEYKYQCFSCDEDFYSVEVD